MRDLLQQGELSAREKSVTPPDFTATHLAVLSDKERAVVETAKKATQERWLHVEAAQGLATLQLLHALAEARMALREAQRRLIFVSKKKGLSEREIEAFVRRNPRWLPVTLDRIDAALARGGK